MNETNASEELAQTSTGDYVYRSMKVDGSGLPVVGRGKRYLGVVVDGDPQNAPNAKPDVYPEDGLVKPDGHGMSVAMGSAWNLPDHRRPRGYFKGTGRDPVFQMDPGELQPELECYPDSRTHAVIQPSAPMPLGDYEGELAQTQELWSKETGR